MNTSLTLQNKFMRYPQQLGRSWKVFDLPRNLLEPHQLSAPENPLDLISFLPRTLQDLVCYLEPSGTSSAAPEPTHNLISHLHRNPPEPHRPSAPEPSGTSSAICTRTLRNLISQLHRNPPEPHRPSAPEPSGTSSAICTRTLRNLISHLHRNHLPRNPPEPHWQSAPKLSGTSSAICTGTLRNFVSHLHRNPPEPSGTLRNLLRNLVLASFAVGEKSPSVPSGRACAGKISPEHFKLRWPLQLSVPPEVPPPPGVQVFTSTAI